MTARRGGREWAVGNLVALAAATGLGLIGFQSSYGGWWFLVPALGGAAAGMAVGWASWMRSWSVLTTLCVGLVAFFVLGGPLALPETLQAVVVPTAETFRGLVEGAVAGWQELITTAPPVGNTPPLLVVPFVTGLVAGAAGSRVALSSRRTFVAVVVPLAVLSTTILVGTRFPVSVVAQGAMFSAVGASWLAWRDRATGLTTAATADRRMPTARRRVTAAVMVALAGAVALPLGPMLPLADARARFTVRELAEPPVDPTAFPTPLGSIRKYTADISDDVLFTVSGLPDGARLRLATMDEYDGIVWGVAGSATGRAGSSGTFERVGAQIADEPEAGVMTASVVIGDYRDYWLPDAGDVISISFGGPRKKELAEGFRFNRSTGTGLQLQRLSSGDEYSMSVVLPQHPDAVELAGLPLGARATPQAQQVEAVAELQGQILAAAQVGPQRFYDLASTLTAALRDEGFYSNGDAEEGRPPSMPGHGSYRLSAFASSDVLLGDEEQYAATAALMTSYAGLPTRVVMGARAPAGVESGWAVRGSDVTAWIEVGLGDQWIPFDVVPDKDKSPPQTQPIQEQPKPAPQEPLPPPPPDLAESVPPSEAHEPSAEEEDAAGGWRIPAAVILTAKVVGPVLLMALAFVVAMAAAKAVRRFARRRFGSPADRIAGGWDEVTSIGRDFGHLPPVRGTRREEAATLGALGATALAEQADAAVFGPQPPADPDAARFWQQVSDFHRDIARRHPWHRRLRALASWRSWRR